MTGFFPTYIIYILNCYVVLIQISFITTIFFFSYAVSPYCRNIINYVNTSGVVPENFATLGRDNI